MGYSGLCWTVVIQIPKITPTRTSDDQRTPLFPFLRPESQFTSELSQFCYLIFQSQNALGSKLRAPCWKLTSKSSGYSVRSKGWDALWTCISNVASANPPASDAEPARPPATKHLPISAINPSGFSRSPIWTGRQANQHFNHPASFQLRTRGVSLPTPSPTSQFKQDLRAKMLPALPCDRKLIRPSVQRWISWTSVMLYVRRRYRFLTPFVVPFLPTWNSGV